MGKIYMAFSLLAFFSSRIHAQTDVTKLPPINELGTGTYKGYEGGLYPDGSNTMPPAFYQDALALAHSIQPLDAEGNPDPNGKIVLAGIGASTVAMFGEGLQSLIPKVEGLRPNLVFFNGGVGGQDLNKMNDLPKYWNIVNGKMRAAGISDAQVQVVWMQEDDLRNTTSAFPERANMLADEFADEIRALKKKFPNLKILYLTGRHTTAFMPPDGSIKHQEPRAYINGWATKFVIGQQINGDSSLRYMGPDAVAPLIMWGPYFWTQGSTPRADGYSWTPDLVLADGVHPTDAGRQKVATDLINFWSSDPVSSVWFTGKPLTVYNSGRDSMEWSGPAMRFYVNRTLIDSVPRAAIRGNLKMVVLKDSTVLFRKDDIPVQDAFIAQVEDSGTFVFVILDQGSLTRAGRIFISPESPENDFSENDQGNDTVTHIARKNMQSKNDVAPDEPAWFVNGKNKLPKLTRLLGGDRYAKVVITDTLSGKVLLEIDDVLHKHTVLNDTLAPGEYFMKFYDENGQEITLAIPPPRYLTIK